MSLNPYTVCPNCSSDFDCLIHTVIRDEEGYKFEEVECKVCGYIW